MTAFSRQVLVATDVAARGLDMIVDLVLNAEPPTHQSGRVDTESYVHRSGRTGRAGRKGMCITLYTPRQRGGLGEIGEDTSRERDCIGLDQGGIGDVRWVAAMVGRNVQFPMLLSRAVWLGRLRLHLRRTHQKT